MVVVHNIKKVKENISITSGDVMQFLRITDMAELKFITYLLESAIETAESFLGYTIYPKIITIRSYDNSNKIHIPWKSVKRILSSKIVSNAGKLKSSRNINCYMDHKEQKLVTDSIPSKNEYVEICYKTSKCDLPNQVRQGIFLHVAEMYDSPDKITISDQILNLYRPYRRILI